MDQDAVLLPPEDWSKAEQALWIAFRSGEELILGDKPLTQKSLPSADYWSADRTIRAEVLATVMLHGPAEKRDSPARLRLTGARVTGTLDVGCGVLASFLFTHCLFDSTPMLSDAKASFVGFLKCLMPGLTASRITCTGPIWANGTRFTGAIDLEDSVVQGDVNLPNAIIESNSNAALDVQGATFGSDLDLSHVEISCTGQSAIFGSQVSIAGSMECDNLRTDRAVYLQGCRIGGRLSLGKAVLNAPKQTVLHLDHARIGLGIHADELDCRGGIRMHHARIGCQVSLSRAQILNRRGVAIGADHLIVEGSILLNGGFRAEGSVDLHGADIECTLNLYGAKLSSDGDWAVAADGIHIGKDLLASGCSFDGGLKMTAAKIEGSVFLQDCQLESAKTFALNASKSTVEGDFIATGKFHARGGISLADANLGVSLQISDAKLSNPESAALNAAGISIRGDLVADRVEATGLLDLASAEISGDVRLADAKLVGVPTKHSSVGTPIDQRRGHNWRGVSLRCAASIISGEVDLRGSEVSQTLMLDMAQITKGIILDGAVLGANDSAALSASGLTAHTLRLNLKSTPRGEVRLSGAQLVLLSDSPNSWPTDAPLDIDGFTYQRLDTSLTIDERLRWLRNATPAYSPQPYEQLATCFLGSGREGDSRQVRLASVRRSYESRAALVRGWGKLQDWTIGFGYIPARAVFIFTALWVGAALWLSYGIGHCQAVAGHPAGLCPIDQSHHPTWDPWLYTLDLLVPIVDLGQKAAWDPIGTSKIIAYVLIVGGWVLTTTIVAAAGRSLRRP